VVVVNQKRRMTMYENDPAIEAKQRSPMFESLRTEARDVKQCFTSYSFQALALCATILAVTFGAMDRFPTIVYAPLPVITLLMAVCRMGLFKYGTANRNYGFELYASREERVRKTASYKFLPEWEEALFAWRIIHPTLFRRIYITPEDDSRAVHLKNIGFGWINSFRPGYYKLKEEIERADDKCKWFMPEYMVRHSFADAKSKPVYHAGNYIRTIFSVLLLSQFFLTVPLLLSFVENITVTAPVIWLLSIIMIIFRDSQVRRRRKILEDELLSIHSSAIVWKEVVYAHQEASKKSGDNYETYISELSNRAINISDNWKSLSQSGSHS